MGAPGQGCAPAAAPRRAAPAPRRRALPVAFTSPRVLIIPPSHPAAAGPTMRTLRVRGMTPTPTPSSCATWTMSGARGPRRSARRPARRGPLRAAACAARPCGKSGAKSAFRARITARVHDPADAIHGARAGCGRRHPPHRAGKRKCQGSKDKLHQAGETWCCSPVSFEGVGPR
ncbi:MAG: hypothetical protein J3K34DRAFT_214071 [Monoraphidium minutum]|nr:MAG: hypothetical protein J3K34DRAFT_214071 [Monoraphidium minutum]